jgi:hypothetical protein
MKLIAVISHKNCYTEFYCPFCTNENVFKLSLLSHNNEYTTGLDGSAFIWCMFPCLHMIGTVQKYSQSFIDS